MSETSEGSLPEGDRRFGWYPQAREDDEGEATSGDPSPHIGTVFLRADEYAGPFWDEHGSVTDDPAQLERWLGISSKLIQDILAWNAAHFATYRQPDSSMNLERQGVLLLERLASEVRSPIRVAKRP